MPPACLDLVKAVLDFLELQLAAGLLIYQARGPRILLVVAIARRATRACVTTRADLVTGGNNRHHIYFLEDQSMKANRTKTCPPHGFHTVSATREDLDFCLDNIKKKR